MNVKQLAAIALVIVAATLTVSTAKADPTPCNPSIAPVNFNADYGLRNYLVGIGSSWWKGKGRLAAPQLAPTGTMCSSVAQAYADQERFYVLLRAFPQTPTRAQWQTRFVPLMQLAAKLDRELLALSHGNSVYIRSITVDLAWVQRVSRTPFGSPAE